MATPRRPPHHFPTSRSLHRPPPAPAAAAADPTQSALVALALLLGGTLLLAALAPAALVPLELHLLGRFLRLRMSALASWLFGGWSRTSAASGSDLADDDRQRRQAEVERYGALLPRPDGPTAVRGGSHSGIVNMSGTFCFLNAILQVLASSPSFLSHAYAVLALSATPVASTSTSSSPAVTAALLPFLLALATPSDARHPRPLRPTELVEALRGSEAFKKAGMFGRLRDQQDAHELWALLAGAVDDEAAAVSKMVDRCAAGLRSLLPPTLPSSSLVGSDGKPQVLQIMPHLPWSGRMAYRRACVVCGYSEGIRLMRSGEVSLSLPERTSMTTLERLLGQVTALEELVDAQCRKCRITRTHASLKAALVADELDELPTAAGEVSSPAGKRKAPGKSAASIVKGSDLKRASNGGAFAALADPSLFGTVLNDNDDSTSGSGPTKARRRRERAGRRELEQRRARLAEVERLMSEGRWEDDVEGVQWALVDGGVSTRQETFSAPPDLLVIHLNRSSFSSYSATKNPCRVAFPRRLDLSPFCTTGELGTDPARPISRRATEGGTLGALAEGAAGAGDRETYSLVGFVNHLGGHSSGHYITYRLIPFSTPDRWLRISDDDVVELPPGGGEEIWRWSGRGEVVLLFYERTARAGGGATGAGTGVVTAASGATPVVTLKMSDDASADGSPSATSLSTTAQANDEDPGTNPTDADPIDKESCGQPTPNESVGSPTPPPASLSPSPPTSPSLKTPPPEADDDAEAALDQAGLLANDEPRETASKRRKKKGRRK